MQLLYPLLAIITFTFTYAKPCSTNPTSPSSCDYDQWHQERKLLISRSTQVNVKCWAPGRPVSGNTRWLYVSDKECWVNSRVLGLGCDGTLKP